MSLSKTGRLEVALAISATSNLVTVDASQNPFKTKPANLFDRSFDNPGVGIADEQMPIFKGNLTAFLPEISADIATIPDNAKQVIREVAKFVKLSLEALG